MQLVEKLALIDLDDTLFDSTGQLYGLLSDNIEQITPFPGMNEALTVPGLTYVLVTRGEPERQMRKVQTLGIQPRFDSIIIVPTDTEKRAVFRTLVGKAGHTWAVGNRLDCEIQYGNECGFTTVYMKHGRYASHVSESHQIPHHTIYHLTELPAILMA